MVTPTPPAGRIVVLDVLRGFALLGVGVVNVYQSFAVRLTPADVRAERLIALLAEGSFYPVFSLLFGLGFALQLQRGVSAARFYRRLTVLFIFGLLHGVFIWHGDILASYALVGYALPALARAPARRRLALAAGGYALTLLLFAASFGLAPSGMPPSSFFAQGSYREILAWRAPHYAAALVGGLLLFGGQLLALFTLGLEVGRGEVAARLADRRWLAGVLLASLLVALPLVAWRAVSGGRMAYVLEYLVGSPALGFAYLAALALAYQTPWGARLLLPLAAIGRTALSTYLAQSLVTTFVFYGYGLGYHGRVGVVGGVLFALGLFAVQMLLSTLWLRRFRYGPMEWLWRSLTYGTLPPWRASSP